MFLKRIGKTLARTLVLAGLTLVAWSVLARPSGAHGPKRIYQVKASDTLWTIAAARNPGDVREAIWRIQTANHLPGTEISPGERLVLP
jgi:hypothetical protein